MKGWVVYVRDGEIRKLNPTTKEDELVAAVNADAYAPSLSPDGSRIAFGGGPGQKHDVFVMDADGSNIENLTESPGADDASPSWSPDGRRIVFHSDSDGNYDIYWMMSSVGGPKPKSLTSDPAQDKHPEWSPDGDWIVFESDRLDDGDLEPGPFDIYVMTSEGESEEPLTESPADDGVPVWSPDGQRIAFRSNRESGYEVWRMDSQGGDEEQVTYEDGTVRAPAWSPDGRRIVFASGTGHDFDLYDVDAGGRDRRVLLESPHDDRGPTWCCFSPRDSET